MNNLSLTVMIVGLYETMVMLYIVTRIEGKK